MRLPLLGTICLTALIGIAGCESEPEPATASTSGPCEAWAMSDSNSHANRTAPDLGCVNRQNLVNMLDRPADIVAGRPLGPSDGDREARAVENYRQGKIAPLAPAAPPGQLILTPGTGEAQ